MSSHFNRLASPTFYIFRNACGEPLSPPIILHLALSRNKSSLGLGFAAVMPSGQQLRWLAPLPLKNKLAELSSGAGTCHTRIKLGAVLVRSRIHTTLSGAWRARICRAGTVLSHNTSGFATSMELSRWGWVSLDGVKDRGYGRGAWRSTQSARSNGALCIHTVRSELGT